MSDKEWDPETLFDLFGDVIARQILVLASQRSMSAEELATHLDASLPTIYRRTDALESYDLVEQRTEISDNGNHYKTFRTTLKEVTFELDSAGCNIDIQLRRDLVDRFEAFWDDLEQSGPEVDVPAPADQGRPQSEGSDG